VLLDGLLVGRIGPLHDRLEALVVLEQAGIEFGLDGAGGRGAGETGPTDVLRDACMECQRTSCYASAGSWRVEAAAWAIGLLAFFRAVVLVSKNALGQRGQGRSA